MVQTGGESLGGGAGGGELNLLSWFARINGLFNSFLQTSSHCKFGTSTTLIYSYIVGREQWSVNCTGTQSYITTLSYLLAENLLVLLLNLGLLVLDYYIVQTCNNLMCGSGSFVYRDWEWVNSANFLNLLLIINTNGMRGSRPLYTLTNKHTLTSLL